MAYRQSSGLAGRLETAALPPGACRRMGSRLAVGWALSATRKNSVALLSEFRSSPKAGRAKGVQNLCSA
jgi:hypothetical protein